MNDSEETQPVTSADQTVDYERSDVNVRTVALATLGLLVVVAVVAMGMAGLFGMLHEWRSKETVTDSPLTTLRRRPPEPRLQVDPAADLAELHQYERDLLHTYRWIDREQGIVRIPIERAVDLLVERDTLNGIGGSDATP